MISLQIKDVKNFMANLLTGNTFDSFLLEEATITTYNTFIIDGHMIKDFFQADEDENSCPFAFSKWEDMRIICFNLIKGKRTPVHFKFVLQLQPDATTKLLQQEASTILPEQLKAFLINIKYDSGHLSLVTATSFHTFLLDKSADILWDTFIKQFLSKHGIDYEES